VSCLGVYLARSASDRHVELSSCKDCLGLVLGYPMSSTWEVYYVEEREKGLKGSVVWDRPLHDHHNANRDT